MRALLLAAWMALAPLPVVAGQAAADRAAVDEADRLFAAAMAQWGDSTSPRVEQLLQRSLVLLQGALPASDPRLARVQDQLGRVFYNRGVEGAGPATFARAEALFAAAVDAAAQSLGPRDLWLATYLGDLGAALREQGRVVEAMQTVCHSLAIRRAVLAADDQRLWGSLDNLSRIRARAGDLAGARALRADAARLAAGRLAGDDPAQRALQAHCQTVPVSQTGDPPVSPRRLSQNGQSLFASFCSQKEDS